MGAVTSFVGRESEVRTLSEMLSKAEGGNGCSVIVSGEAGLGKTALINEFMRRARDAGARVLRGGAVAEDGRPFLPFEGALAAEGASILPKREVARFDHAFAIDPEGKLLGEALRGGDGTADGFAPMLSAVQDFVGDTFTDSAGSDALGRLEYGSTVILVEKGSGFSIGVSFKGEELPGMRDALRRAVADSAQCAGGASMQAALDALAAASFAARRDLQEVRLESERIKIAESIMSHLTGKTGQRPTVLVLEDLHWADDASLFAMAYVARNIRQSAVVVVGTMRPGESKALGKAIEGMKVDDSVVEMALGRLGSEDVGSIVGSVCGPHDIPDDFIGKISSRCQGNPFFVTELLKQMMADGAIALSGGRRVLASEDYSIPTGVEDIVKRRLESLEPDAMSMAEYASCIGREFDVAAALSLDSIPDPTAALRGLSDSGIVSVSGEKGEFSHALFQDAIYKGISPTWLSAHHRRLGDYYERAYGANIDGALYELARHFSRSGEHRKGYDYCILAGDKASGALAAEQATSFYETALSKVPKLHTPPGVEVELRLKLGQVCALYGNYARGIEVLREAVRIAPEPAAKARAHRSIADIYEKKGEHDVALAEVEAGEALVNGGEERWRLQMSHAWLLIRKGDYDRSHFLLDEAMASAHAEGSEKDLASIYNMLGVIHVHRANYDKGLEYYDKARDIYERLGEAHTLAKVYNNISNVYGDRADIPRCLETLKKAQALIDNINDPQSLSFIYNNMGAAYFTAGDMGNALDYFGKGLKLFERTGNPWGTAQLYINMGIIKFSSGDTDGAADYYGKSLALREKIDDKRGIALSLCALGDVARQKNDLRGADGLYSRALAITREIGARSSLPDALQGLAETRVASGKPAEAIPFIEESIEICAEADLKDRLAEGRRLHARALALLGEFPRAGELFAAAERGFVELGSEPEAASTRLEWGSALLKAGKKGEAVESLRKARGTFEKLGEKGKLEECDRLLQDASR